MEEWLEQVWFIPAETKPNSVGIIISCGIHGNETGPIVACNALLDLVRSKQLIPAVSLLLIFGNPQAINAKQRYLDFNLNRLFGNSTAGGTEAQRARQLEQACHRLQQQCGRIRWHLDLHSTIKPSRIERFALTPVTRGEYQLQWRPLLYAGGFRGLVRQTRRANTFSQYTHDHFGTDSFTLECGSLLQPTNQGDNALLEWLVAMVTEPSALASEHQDAPLQEFRVAEDIIRHSDQFQFMIDEQEPNFSPHPKGSLIYSDRDGPFYTSEQRYSLFLNSRVEVGQRAGLLLERIQ
ncbi:MAG: hypothetical protein CMK89_20885 [Pseudomonadales bacterium]|nr:hypothetical protein [Pseudomonadales bacterium]